MEQIEATRDQLQRLQCDFDWIGSEIAHLERTFKKLSNQNFIYLSKIGGLKK